MEQTQQPVTEQMQQFRVQQILQIFNQMRRLRVELILWGMDAPIESMLAEMLSREALMIVSMTQKKPEVPVEDQKPNA